MQIKFKKQIDIELDRSDLLEAVQDLLAKNGQTITAAELEEVKFINSPQTGIRATLKITEESVSAEDVVNTSTELPTSVAPVVAEPEPEAPGEIPAPTVQDVAPEVAAAVDLVLPAEPDVEEEAQAKVQAAEEPATAVTEGRTKLFM